MKKIILTLTAIGLFFIHVHAQEGHKINASFDFSFGLNYFNSNIENPTVIAANLGYEHNFTDYLGIEIGIKGGQFHQTVRYGNPTISPSGIDNNNSLSKNIYKGNLWAPYIAPRLYYPLGEDNNKGRSKYLYLENKFSYTQSELKLDEIDNLRGTKSKSRIEYEIKLGFAYPIEDNWMINCWLGYNTYDFGRIKPEVIRFKNASPIQIGLGFSYIIK